eukprot:364594-Chlamydomonas_euryale.AAC.12
MLQLRVMSSYLLAARQLPPAAEAPPDYDLRPLSAPVLTGVVLRAFTWALEGPAGNVIVPLMLWRSGITQVRAPARGAARAGAPPNTSGRSMRCMGGLHGAPGGGRVHRPAR